MSDDFKGRGGSPWGAPPGGGGNGSGRESSYCQIKYNQSN